LQEVVSRETVARDVAYDAFFTILNHRDRVTSPKQFLGYVFQTARLKAIDLQRREQKRIDLRVPLEVLDEIPDPILSPDEAAMQKEDWMSFRVQLTAIESAMDQLTEVERTVIQRSLFDDHRPSDIARDCHVSVERLYRIRYNAIRKLRNILATA
jgi:RNA polymerase sigma factor (sigma-70 family)